MKIEGLDTELTKKQITKLVRFMFNSGCGLMCENESEDCHKRCEVIKSVFSPTDECVTKINDVIKDNTNHGFTLIDKRTPKLAYGMIVREYINGKFTREFVVHDSDEVKNLDTENNKIVWEIIANGRVFTHNHPMYPENGENYV